MPATAEVYSDLGRETADAVIAGRLDTDGLAAVAKAVLDLDPVRAARILDSGGSQRHHSALPRRVAPQHNTDIVRN